MWVAGFVLTGELRHGATERSLRGLDPRTVLVRLCCIVIVGVSVTWFVTVVPRFLRNQLLFFVIGLLAARLAFWLGYVVLSRSIVAYTHWRNTRGESSDSFTSISEISRRLH